MKPQVNPDHYFNPNYDNKERFVSYWHQIQEIVRLKPQKVLEIGIGNGFVSDYLRERNFDITTVDLDPRLNPDLTASLLNLPFVDNSFDVVVCYEVLEHLQYRCLHDAISEIYRVSKSHAILSIPDVNKVLRISLHIPNVIFIKKLFPIPSFRKNMHVFDGQHYWEIGKQNYSLNRFIDDIENVGFELLETYQIFEKPYHRLFILKKNTI